MAAAKKASLRRAGTTRREAKQSLACPPRNSPVRVRSSRGRVKTPYEIRPKGMPMFQILPRHGTIKKTPRWVLVLLMAMCCQTAAVGEPESDVGRQPIDVQYAWGLRIPMRDGVLLNATMYRPLEASGNLPAIITITPYIGDRYQPDAQYFARHGFAFLVVDTRGRGNSEGVFRPFREDDGRDGHDIVEWVARQALVQRQGGVAWRLLWWLQSVGHRRSFSEWLDNDRTDRLCPSRHRLSHGL